MKKTFLLRLIVKVKMTNKAVMTRKKKTRLPLSLKVKMKVVMTMLRLKLLMMMISVMKLMRILMTTRKKLPRPKLRKLLKSMLRLSIKLRRPFIKLRR